MNNYIYILRALLTVRLYTKYRLYVVPPKEELHINILYKYLDSLHKKLEKDITPEEYILYVSTETNNDPTILGLLEILSSCSVSDDVILDAVTTVRNRKLLYELAQLSLDATEGKKTVADVLDFTSKFEDNTVAQRENLIVDMSKVFDNEEKSGLNWRLHSLNESLGPLRKGDFGFIFARPESGKTTFLASEASYMAEQTDQVVLWFNNEQGGDKVGQRCIQAWAGCLSTEAKKYKDSYLNSNAVIKIVDSASLHRKEVEHYIKEHNPALIIFDQIDKIKGFDNDRNDLRLGGIYIWARELAKKYCPVIGVCQADGSGEGKKWLTMDNVADSKTAKQAEADWILGIGKSHSEGFEYVRHMHLSKNKLTGKHTRFDVLIDPEHARYKDI